MGQLTSNLTTPDIEILLEAMGDWEAVNDHDYHVLGMVKNMAMPPEDHESYTLVNGIKEYYSKRSKNILDTRAVSKEQAILIKAKLMLLKQDIALNRLFEEASGSIDDLGKKKLQERLALAERFIEEMGVTSHYEKFLAEQE